MNQQEAAKLMSSSQPSMYRAEWLIDYQQHILEDLHAKLPQKLFDTISDLVVLTQLIHEIDADGKMMLFFQLETTEVLERLTEEFMLPGMRADVATHSLLLCRDHGGHEQT
jgi:hypothetical protein